MQWETIGNCQILGLMRIWNGCYIGACLVQLYQSFVIYGRAIHGSVNVKVTR